MRLDKCKLAVDLRRFKITYIYINQRVLRIKTDDEENVGRETLPRQSILCLRLYICNKIHGSEKNCTTVFK